VTKTYSMSEFIQLEFIRVIKKQYFFLIKSFPRFLFKEIGLTYMRVSQGVESQLQLSSLLARLCQRAKGNTN
jgi:hypothetical protein